MNRNHLSRDPLADYNRLRDSALADAEAARRQALDDFWRGADAVLSTAATHTRRAAERLLQRLRRRASKPAPPMTTTTTTAAPSEAACWPNSA